MRFALCLAGFSGTLMQAALAQTSSTASISGRVLSEEGRTLRASVTLSFAAARGFPAPPRRVLSGTDGVFSFSRLPAGTYKLCAQVSASEAAPANAPFVDTCVWGSGQTPIALADGQQVAGAVFTAPKGAWLRVRVTDPDRALPLVSGKGPAALEPDLQVMLKGPDQLYRHAGLASHDSGGRNYQAAIPLKTPVNLKMTGRAVNVFDLSGKRMAEEDEVGVQAATAADLQPVTFTIRRK
jgi:hypothetical protein